MRAVIQRVTGAAVTIAGDRVAEIVGPGLLVLVAVTHSDSPEQARRLANKIHGLRIFNAPPNDPGPREVSIGELALPVLVVSQFTLYGTTEKGRRPTWDLAAPSAIAEPLVDVLVAELRVLGLTVATGRFGADMAVSLTNDGPMTLIVDAS